MSELLAKKSFEQRTFERINSLHSQLERQREQAEQTGRCISDAKHFLRIIERLHSDNLIVTLPIPETAYKIRVIDDCDYDINAFYCGDVSPSTDLDLAPIKVVITEGDWIREQVSDNWEQRAFIWDELDEIRRNWRVGDEVYLECMFSLLDIGIVPDHSTVNVGFAFVAKRYGKVCYRQVATMEHSIDNIHNSKLRKPKD